MRLATTALVFLLASATAVAQDRYGASDSPPPFADLGDAFGSGLSQPTNDPRYGATGASTSPPAAQPPTASSRLQPRAGFSSSTPASRQPASRQPASRPPSARPAPSSSPLPQDRFSQNNTFSRSQPPSRSPAPPSSSSASASKPQAIMRAMLAAPRDSQLSGSPVGLGDVLAGAATRSEQSRRVDAYWDLCSSVADYYLGLREAEELRRLQRKVPSASTALRQAARELQMRVGTSQKAAVATQRRLANLMGRPSLVLPGDMPHCGDYDTRFAEIFAGRNSLEASKLNELLPLRYAELRGAAEAVGRSESWVQSVAKQPSQTGAGVIRALELLALNRRAFVQIARDYNRRITRYTELSRPGRMEGDRLVSMLILGQGARLSSAAGSDSPSGVTFRSPSGSARR